VLVVLKETLDYLDVREEEVVQVAMESEELPDLWV